MMHQTISVSARRASSDATRWAILRTAAGRTLPLAAALAEAGYEVWTPSQTQKRRTQRGKTKTTEVTVPLMPTFVFVRAMHIESLRSVLRLPICPLPAFSIFHFLGDIPRVSNAEIERLRTEETRGQPKHGGPRFAAGASVRVEDKNFTGMAGQVVRSEGGYTFVCFGGAFEFKIASMHLRTDEVHSVQPR